MEASVTGGCLNCGAPLEGAWCAQCGQRAAAVRPTLQELLLRVYILCSVLFFGVLSLVPARKLHVSVTKGDAQLIHAAERANRDPQILARAFESAFPKAMFILMPHFRFVGIVRLLLFLTLFPHLAIALRRVYGGSRWLTAAKTAGIATIYCGLMLVPMGLIALVTLRRLG